MSKPRKTKRERLALRHVYTEFGNYRRELVDRNLSADPGPKATIHLPKREAKLLAGTRGELGSKSARFHDAWNSPRPVRAGTWRGQEMFFGGGKGLKEKT